MIKLENCVILLDKFISEKDNTTGIINISNKIKIILQISIVNLKKLSGKNTIFGKYFKNLITFSLMFIFLNLIKIKKIFIIFYFNTV